MIKYLEGLEKIESRKLYEEVFNDSVEFTDYYYGEHANLNKILGCFEDSKISLTYSLWQPKMNTEEKDIWKGC